MTGGGREPAARDGEAPASRRGAAIGLLVVVLLIVAALFLEHVLHRQSQLQDCVLSGRTDCAPIDPSSVQ